MEKQMEINMKNSGLYMWTIGIWGGAALSMFAHIPQSIIVLKVEIVLTVLVLVVLIVLIVRIMITEINNNMNNMSRGAFGLQRSSMPEWYDNNCTWLGFWQDGCTIDPSDDEAGPPSTSEMGGGVPKIRGIILSVCCLPSILETTTSTPKWH